MTTLRRGLALVSGSAWSRSPESSRAPLRFQVQGHRRLGSTSASSSTESDELLPLPRSLPARKGLLLLSLPIPPSSWPSHLELSSPLISTTSTSLKSSGIAVNAIYDGHGRGSFSKTPRRHDIKEVSEETYPARLFYPDGKVFSFPAFSKATLSSTSFLSDLRYRPELSGSGSDTANVNVVRHPSDPADRSEILVCTHGNRDCRCSDKGGKLVDALRREIRDRDLGEKIRVREIAHVGGHKYAANVLLLPSLDLLGNLSHHDSPNLIDHVLENRPLSSSIWSNWRGRYGLTEQQQADVWRQVNPETTGTTSTAATADASSMTSTASVGKTVLLKFKTFEGEIKEVEASLGENLLTVGRRNNLPALEGVCGGHLECATCHLYLAPSNSIPAPVPEATDEESDMLGYALSYKEGQSRLGCQIKVTDELVEWVADGGVIGLPRF